MDGVGEERLELDLGLLADVVARVPALRHRKRHESPPQPHPHLAENAGATLKFLNHPETSAGSVHHTSPKFVMRGSTSPVLFVQVCFLSQWRVRGRFHRGPPAR